MELQNNKFVRSIRDSLLHWFSEATEMFFQKKSYVRLHNIRQIKVELFQLTLGGDEDYRKCLESASSAAPCPAPIRIHLSRFTDEKTEALER